MFTLTGTVSYRNLAGDVPWLRTRLMRWFNSNGRVFPWRQTRDAYHVLLAEMMLRRTQAEQVVPVYTAFLERYPDALSLAGAEFHEVASILWPLGLHGRTGEIVQMGRDLRDLFGGRVPATREGLRRLTGVGDYVAGAVLSVAFGRREWIVDTNVVRVFQRFFGLALPGEARRNRLMISMAEAYSRSSTPGRANLALLDHAALICRAVKPLCLDCPICARCSYFRAQFTDGTHVREVYKHRSRPSQASESGGS